MATCGKLLYATNLYEMQSFVHGTLAEPQIYVLDVSVRLGQHWRHNGRNCVSNHQPHDFLVNHLFRRRPKKTSKLRVTGLCAGNSPVTGEFPAQMASNVENVFICWRHHDLWTPTTYLTAIAKLWQPVASYCMPQIYTKCNHSFMVL